MFGHQERVTCIYNMNLFGGKLYKMIQITDFNQNQGVVSKENVSLTKLHVKVSNENRQTLI